MMRQWLWWQRGVLVCLGLGGISTPRCHSIEICWFHSSSYMANLICKFILPVLLSTFFVMYVFVSLTLRLVWSLIFLLLWVIVGFLLWPFLFVVRTLSVSLGLSTQAVRSIFGGWVMGPPIIFLRMTFVWLWLASYIRMLKSVLCSMDLPLLNSFYSLTWYIVIPNIVLAGRCSNTRSC